MVRTFAIWTVLTTFVLFTACNGDDGKATDTSPAGDLVDVTSDLATPDVPAPDAEADTTADLAATDVPPDTSPPEAFCLEELGASKILTLPGMDGPVEVVLDRWGVPHIYATTDHDLFAAQGFMVARYRFIQMHVMRSIAKGVYSSAVAAGAGDLSNDVYMRVIGLHKVAQEMWADIQANDPELTAMLESFAQGVNAYITAVQDKTLGQPLEWPLVGEITPWTPVDTLAIGRLQSWDLSFQGRTDQLVNMARFQELMARWGESELAGIVLDIHPLAPATQTLSLPEADRQPAPTTDAAWRLPLDLLAKAPAGYFAQAAQAVGAVPMTPGDFGTRDVGSNNWTVSAGASADGHAMVANDTHLSLRNPAVFYEVHLNTTRAGGDLDLAGVCFPGIPAVILGRNAHAAWGGTVYYADVTDIYVEEVTPGDPPTVRFNESQVPMTIRQETFHYALPEDGCEAWVDAFIAGTKHTVDEVDGACVLTVDIEEVPHHGPIIPGTYAETEDGGQMALSWRWTGMEPSSELRTVYEFMRMDSPEEFLAGLEHFKVGAQNWVYADDAGNIAYAALCRLPLRSQLAAGEDVENPPFLPVPGTGCCEWTGDVPLEAMPRSVNPERGWIFTANGDAFGYTLDGNPFNDAVYQGYMFDIGFRAARVEELLAEKHADGGLTLADLQAVQADHRSPLGMLLTPHLLAAVDAAVAAADGEDGADPALAPFATQRIQDAAARLADWDYMAESGALPEATDAEKASAVATSIFNAWAVFLSQRVLADKMETPYDLQFQGRFLINLVTRPETMATYDPELEDSRLWDDTTTAEVTESRNLIMLQALAQALDFLADPGQVGVAAMGGFGTDDMDQWLWGNLHTLTLPHALGGNFNIPAADEFPEGYPRHGDNFNVDASNPGLNDTGFTFRSGPSIRNVYILDPAGPRAETVIPGGQDMSVAKPHYKDQFALWVANETHPLHGNAEALLPDAEDCWVMEP